MAAAASCGGIEAWARDRLCTELSLAQRTNSLRWHGIDDTGVIE